MIIHDCVEYMEYFRCFTSRESPDMTSAQSCFLLKAFSSRWASPLLDTYQKKHKTHPITKAMFRLSVPIHLLESDLWNGDLIYSYAHTASLNAQILFIAQIWFLFLMWPISDSSVNWSETDPHAQKNNNKIGSSKLSYGSKHGGNWSQLFQYIYNVLQKSANLIRRMKTRMWRKRAKFF